MSQAVLTLLVVVFVAFLILVLAKQRLAGKDWPIRRDSRISIGSRLSWLADKL